MNIEIANLDNLTADEKKTLEKLVEKANRKSKAFKPTDGEKYYFIAPNGIIHTEICNQHPHFDCMRFQLGNCFATRKDAEFALEKQKVYTELKRYALEHNECAIDWGDTLQSKCCIRYNYDSNEFGFLFGYKIKNMGTIYFTNEEIAKNAISEVGEDRIKKYLFEVEEND